MLKIIRPVSYQKREKKFFKKHPELIKQYTKALKLLSLDLTHPSLRLHEIKSKACHSISINMQYRVLLTLKVLENGEVILIDIGDHDIYR
ncbi:plasmid stabilization protein [Catenovulum sp. SM1970]|uniref:type II toxin-antitoxin system RelE/ParE family toxin n=1 Tax=Marinifaba aquimaris TaxID=2741323 RepID=UPI00157306C5|nr:plasmid stabilization protein [Marinifaba aquimaris]NTS75443.1 plasmid stabilization protein [Marinifaba aquimaris]